MQTNQGAGVFRVIEELLRSDEKRTEQHGVSGLLFDWRSSSLLADAIAQLHALSPESRHEMGLRGRALAEMDLSLDRMVTAYEKLLTTARAGEWQG